MITDPYEFMNLNYDCTIHDLRKRFKKMALYYHPDKSTGNEELFNKLKISYQEIFKQLSKEEELLEKMKKKVLKKKYKDIKMKKIKQLNPKKFNLERFNKLFDKYKLEDIEESGYEEYICNKKKSREQLNELQNNKIKKINQSLVLYEDPEGYIDSKLEYKELGIKKRNNFNKNGKSNYQDYLLAYTDKPISIENEYLKKNNRIRKDYQSINHLQSSRENISYNMSENDRVKEQIQEKRRKIQEKKRMLFLQQQDKLIEKRYNEFQNLIKM